MKVNGMSDKSLPPSVSDKRPVGLLKTTSWILIVLALCFASLHISVSLILLESYTELVASNFSSAKQKAMLAKRLSDLSPTVAIDTKKAIDRQIALSVAAERPTNGTYSALISELLLAGKYQIPNEVSVKDIVSAARISNLRGDIGAPSIFNEKILIHKMSVAPNERAELDGEVAYDRLREVVFVLGAKDGKPERAEELEQKLQSVIAPIQKQFEESQKILCETIPYRCEINKIRWLVAKCSYRQELLGAIDNQCLDQVRHIYLDSIGHASRNDAVFDKCIRRYGAQGCSTMAAELPSYMEALLLGYGNPQGGSR